MKFLESNYTFLKVKRNTMYATQFSEGTNGNYELKVDLNLFEATKKWLINQKCQYKSHKLSECGWFIIHYAPSTVIYRLSNRFASPANDNDSIEVKVEALRNVLSEQRWSAIKEVTQHWHADIKKMVWLKLQPQEREAISYLAENQKQEEVLNALKTERLKRMVVILQVVDIIPKNINLTPKKKEDFLAIIKEILPHERQAIQATLTLVLGSDASS